MPGVLRFLLPLLLLALTLSAAAHAQTTTGTTADGLIYTSTSGTVSITGYSGTGGAVNIQSTINISGTNLPVTCIRANAFKSRSSVTSVTIPNSVTTIGSSAFNYTGLTSVTIPASVTSIGDSALGGCPSLTSITVDILNPAYSNSGDGVLFNKSQSTLIQWPAGKAGSYTIPNSVNSIGNYAFQGCAGLTSVTIPSSVTSIGSSAFSSTGLTSVTIPDSVTSIGSAAFTNCASLTSVTLSNNLTSIASSAFMNCTSLTNLSIPGSVISIGNDAFGQCYSLTSVTIPKSVTSMGNGPFEGCTALTSITVDGSNPAYSSSADGVMFNKNQTILIQYPAGKVGAYTIPSSVTSIASSALQGSHSLTSITIPNSVTSIGSSAFWGCIALTSVTIPNSVTSIGISAFQSCIGLTSVTIPNSITSITNTVFAFCSGLKSVTIPSSVTSIANQAFWCCSCLTSAIFMGNAPSTSTSAFGNPASGFAVYYFSDKTGFSSPWNGCTTVNMGPSSPVTPWLISKALPYNADIQSTPNNDGVSLLMDYALYLDPTKNQSASIPKAVVVGSNMSLTYYAGSAGITYTVETSADLQNWGTTGVTLSGPDANGCYTATMPISGAPCFMRLKVVK